MCADVLRRSLALFVAASSLAACDTLMTAPAPAGQWHIEDRGRFTFYARPGSFAEAHLSTFAEVLGEQFTIAVRRLDLRYDGRVTFYLHPSGEDAGFGSGVGPDHSGVAYPQMETVKVAVVEPLDGNLFSLLSHEMNHVILHNGLGRPGTTFVNEGLASAVMSERFNSRGPTFLHRWVAQRRAQVPRLVDLIDDEKWRGVEQSIAYNASASFLAWLLDRYGPEPLKRLYYAPTRDFEGVCQAAYGRSLTDLEADWAAWISALQ